MKASHAFHFFSLCLCLSVLHKMNVCACRYEARIHPLIINDYGNEFNDGNEEKMRFFVFNFPPVDSDYASSSTHINMRHDLNKKKIILYRLCH